MSVLNITPVFEDKTSLLRDQEFRAMYFGRHFRKNVLILKHDLTLLFVFGDDYKWLSPEFVKSVSFRGEPRKGSQIVGNENVILLLDAGGNLWRLINAFESADDQNKCFHSLEEEFFYEWIPFNKFNFAKVLAITKFGGGFACIGLRRNLEKKLVVLQSLDSVLEDYTFDELSTVNSFSYYLTNLSINIKNSVYKNILLPAEEVLLVGNRHTGRLYLCSISGTKSLISQSDIYLVSVLHFEMEKCLLLCFESGKLSFIFYNESRSSDVVYLSKKIVCLEKCCCSGSCFLWSDGVKLQHAKLTFHCDNIPVKVSHLKLNWTVVCPLSFLKIGQNVLTVTINRIYYCVSPGIINALEIRRGAEEILTEIYNGSGTIAELQKKIDVLTYYLSCKEMVQKNRAKVEISWEGNRLLLKTRAGNFLREFWKVKLTASAPEKNLVQMFDLDCDLREGMLIAIENPFKSKSKMKVSLVGDFHGNNLFVHLGEVGEAESDLGALQLSKQLKEILSKRNPYIKET